MAAVISTVLAGLATEATDYVRHLVATHRIVGDSSNSGSHDGDSISVSIDGDCSSGGGGGGLITYSNITEDGGNGDGGGSGGSCGGGGDTSLAPTLQIQNNIDCSRLLAVAESLLFEDR